MNDWLKKQLEIQFDRAADIGWLPFFIEAAKTHTSGFFDEADLLGIASRETNLDPKWLKKAGDGGNGFGLMQADVRSFPEWIKSGKWRDAREGILMGARVLMQKWTDVQDCIGKRRSARSSKTGKLSFFVGKDVGTSAEAQKVSIAAYNAGRWAHYAVSNNSSADKLTTGKDYSSDVIARAAFFRPLIKKWMKENGYLLEEKTENSLLTISDIENIGTPDAQKPEMPEDSQQENTVSTDAVKTDSDNPENSQPLTAYIPNMDTAKSWLTKVGGFLTSSTFIAIFAGVPNWLIISLIALIAILIISGAVFLWKYQKEVFGFVKTIQTLNANPQMANFVIKTHKSNLEKPLSIS